MGKSRVKLYLDNIIYFLQKSGGGSVYWTELLKRFLDDDDFNVTCLEQNSKHSNFFRNTVQPYKIILENKFSLRITRYLPAKIPNNGQIALFHSSYYRHTNSPAVKNIVTIHDLIIEYFYKGPLRWTHLWQKSAILKKADLIICISQNTKNDLIKFYSDINLDVVKVIYNGVNDCFRKLASEKLNYKINNIQLSTADRGIIYIGHRSRYKNFLTAVSVMSKLPREYKLYIIGDDLAAHERQRLDAALPARYVFLGKVTSEDLNMIYNFSYCLLYPSSYEGFGIPILEAMRSGCPVVAVSNSAIPEITKQKIYLIDEVNDEKFRQKILEIETDPLKNERIKLCQEIANEYSWNKCYNELKQAYLTLL